MLIIRIIVGKKRFIASPSHNTLQDCYTFHSKSTYITYISTAGMLYGLISIQDQNYQTFSRHVTLSLYASVTLNQAMHV